ncbi:hypothetical protein MTO96_003231 [Rhipicephalus appendiculatus]
MSFPGLAPPLFFLATPGRPPLPWEQWEQMFNVYLVASGAADRSYLCRSFQFRRHSLPGYNQPYRSRHLLAYCNLPCRSRCPLAWCSRLCCSRLLGRSRHFLRYCSSQPQQYNIQSGRPEGAGHQPGFKTIRPTFSLRSEIVYILYYANK